MTNFTPEELIMYLYKESSSQQYQEIESALQADWTLNEKLNILKTSMQRLNRITESPRTEVVLKVLNYARKKAVAEVI